MTGRGGSQAGRLFHGHFTPRRQEIVRISSQNKPDANSAVRAASMLTLPYPPSVNHLYSTVRGRRVLSAVGREYKRETGWMAAAQGATCVSGPVELTVRVYRPRRAGDLDNTLKAAQDALTGICWADDSQVVAIHAFRYDDKSNPRIEVEVKQA